MSAENVDEELVDYEEDEENVESKETAGDDSGKEVKK
eukprot:CAMPEP_0116071262 /NCGR_PEP_ID=MMETSP0322-20121206/13629_1 /TAXON_ID=163516 /ORGANISM="Leptocylindrus danicus var. apora, Strain B651" /LENGTH=36 /DNA_ID= /DNA_START= /DNA_END= /DNA_ORIENTATION=